MNDIVIGSTNVSIKEYKGQRVVTFKDICALVFGKSNKSANGALSSSACRKGLIKKVCTLLIVVVAQRIDILTGSEYIRNAVVIAFCVSELISICENAGLMGILPEGVQKILNKAIDVLKNKNDK